MPILERYGFFDSADGDERLYSAADFAEYFADFVPSGVAEPGDNLRVYAQGGEQAVRVKCGRAWLRGYYYDMSGGEDKVLAISAADSRHPRMDAVVLHLDAAAESRSITLRVISGTPAADPQPPALTRTENVYEICLARVRVAANAATIGADAVTDTRELDDLCGIVTDRAQRVTYTAKLTAAGWAKRAGGGWTQTVSVPGLRDGDRPYISVQYGDDNLSNIEIREDWTHVSRAIASHGACEVICFDDAPTADLTMRIEVIR